MVVPCIVKKPVERLRRHDVETGPGELQAHRGRLEAGDDQEDEPGGHVHDPEPLVVDGHDPLVEQRQQRRARADGAWLAVTVLGHHAHRSPRPRHRRVRR